MKVLHIDSSILGGNSVSRQLSASVVEKLATLHPHLEITHRDLAAAPVPYLSGPYLAATRGGAPDEQSDALKADIALGAKVLDEFLMADVVVIGVALYNFSIPSQLKSWIDRIVIAGKTFRYSEKGPEGLAGGKRVVVAMSRGGVYAPGSPAAPLEHGETYLRGVLAFMGISEPEFVMAEGVNVSPAQRDAAVQAALGMVAALQAA